MIKSTVKLLAVCVNFLDFKLDQLAFVVLFVVCVCVWFQGSEVWHESLHEEDDDEEEEADEAKEWSVIG